MSKYDVLDAIVKENNGYLFSSDVQKASISRTYMADYVRDKRLEKVSQGIYVTEDTWPDELFIMQKCYPAIVFSGETALYLHNLIDREYSSVMVTVPAGFSGSRLRSKGVIIHSEKEDQYKLGITEVVTNFGNTVRCYDKERCFCDTVKSRKKFEVQNYQTAVLTYMRAKDRDLSKLIRYAKTLGISDEIMKYVEVLV